MKNILLDNRLVNYFRSSFKRKIARRFRKEYPAKIESFQLENTGTVEFANWQNPLVTPVSIHEDMIAFFRQFIKEGDVAIDIGANVGDTTVPIGVCTGVSGLTIGFDPNPYLYKILQTNASLNKDKTNIVTFPYAISSQEEEFYFISSEAAFSNGGISSTPHSRHGRFVHSEKIKGVNLKNFMEQNFKERLDKLSFIKIDTEGYDKEILKSIADLVNKYKPVIIAESFGKSTNEAKMELFDVIARMGYNIYYFEDFNINVKTEHLKNRNDIIKWKNTINVYAVPAAGDKS